MEIGSFIELDIRCTGEYYQEEVDIARLNTARAGIYHSLRLLNAGTIYLPYYLCPTVRNFLSGKGISIHYYSINGQFEPLDLHPEKGSAVLLTNYFGIFSSARMEGISHQFGKVIIDNSQAFFSPPINGCYSIYSPRKFFGVPDGCYVIGKDAQRFTEEYPQDYSSETAAFLLKRIEYGSSPVYSERMKNEERLDKSDIKRMSLLTRTLLKGIDYNTIREKRANNFVYAHSLFSGMNLLNPLHEFSDVNVPMIYPLMVEDAGIVQNLKDYKIYTGRWWKDVLKQVAENSFEGILSTYMIPVPIDQRYGKNEIHWVYKKIVKGLGS